MKIELYRRDGGKDNRASRLFYVTKKEGGWKTPPSDGGTELIAGAWVAGGMAAPLKSLAGRH
jgi:hypothetical protein